MKYGAAMEHLLAELVRELARKSEGLEIGPYWVDGKKVMEIAQWLSENDEDGGTGALSNRDIVHALLATLKLL